MRVTANRTRIPPNSSRGVVGSANVVPHQARGMLSTHAHSSKSTSAAHLFFKSVSKVGKKHLHIATPFHLQLGGSLPHLDIVWEEWGPHMNHPTTRDLDVPTVLVLPSLSMGSHAAASAVDPSPGWWEGMIGAGALKGIDTDHFRVICPSILGSPFGTTSALSTNPATGMRYGPTFPAITPVDQARVHHLLLQHLGIQKLHAVIGSSLGGMQALCYATEYPDHVERLVAICTTGHSSPGTVALRHVQRLAILSDPDYQGGFYTEQRPPIAGLAVARQLGVICYRSRDEFNGRFSWNASPPYQTGELSFEVERYLEAQSTKFKHHYDANCYLTLSRCMDLMDLGRGHRSYAEAVNRIRANTLLIAFDKDALIPPEETQKLYQVLKKHRTAHKHAASTQEIGSNFNINSNNNTKQMDEHSIEDLGVEYLTHPSLFGHDAFLKEYPFLNPVVRRFLKRQQHSEALLHQHWDDSTR